MARITVRVDEKGVPSITVEGAVGEECYKLTESLERKGKVLIDEKTEEYYERETEKNTVVNRR